MNVNKRFQRITFESLYFKTQAIYKKQANLDFNFFLYYLTLPPSIALNNININSPFFTGILEESPTNEDNVATTKAKYFYQSCMNMCKLSIHCDF